MFAVASLIRQVALLVDLIGMRLMALTNLALRTADSTLEVSKDVAVKAIKAADEREYKKVEKSFANADTVQRLAEHMKADAEDLADAYALSVNDRQVEIMLIRNERL